MSILATLGAKHYSECYTCEGHKIVPGDTIIREDKNIQDMIVAGDISIISTFIQDQLNNNVDMSFGPQNKRLLEYVLDHNYVELALYLIEVWGAQIDEGAYADLISQCYGDDLSKSVVDFDYSIIQLLLIADRYSNIQDMIGYFNNRKISKRMSKSIIISSALAQRALDIIKQKNIKNMHEFRLALKKLACITDYSPTTSTETLEACIEISNTVSTNLRRILGISPNIDVFKQHLINMTGQRAVGIGISQALASQVLSFIDENSIGSIEKVLCVLRESRRKGDNRVNQNNVADREVPENDNDVIMASSDREESDEDDVMVVPNEDMSDATIVLEEQEVLGCNYANTIAPPVQADRSFRYGRQNKKIVLRYIEELREIANHASSIEEFINTILHRMDKGATNNQACQSIIDLIHMNGINDLGSFHQMLRYLQS